MIDRRQGGATRRERGVPTVQPLAALAFTYRPPAPLGTAKQMHGRAKHTPSHDSPFHVPLLAPFADHHNPQGDNLSNVESCLTCVANADGLSAATVETILSSFDETCAAAGTGLPSFTLTGITATGASEATGAV